MLMRKLLLTKILLFRKLACFRNDSSPSRLLYLPVSEQTLHQYPSCCCHYSIVFLSMKTVFIPKSDIKYQLFFFLVFFTVIIEYFIYQTILKGLESVTTNLD